MKIQLAKIIFLTALAVSPCSGVELLSNGDFETGAFPAWTTVDQAGGSGSFFISTPGTPTPLSGFSTAPNPSGGSFYAVTDQTGPGCHVLLQTFTIPSSPLSVILTFQMFVNNYAGAAVINPAGLDYTASPNEHARVDILTGAASPFDTGAGVLTNLYIGSDTGANPNPYTSYSFDITSIVATPGTYQIRFAEADNLGFFNLGVDNVSIAFTVPEPSTTVLLFASGPLIFFLLRLKRGPNSIIPMNGVKRGGELG